MRTAELSPELGVPLQWVETRRVKKNSMALVTVSNKSGEKSVLISPRGVLVVDSKNYVVAPKERVSSKPSTAKRISSAAVKSLGWGSVAALVLFAVLNTAGVLTSRVVLTGSMAPSIKPGDVVVAASTKYVKPHLKDVVIYTGKRFDGTTVASFTHRIIAGDAVNGFTVKGDHNENADVQKPKLSEIEGVVLFTIPLLGKLLTTQMLILMALAGFGLWLIVDAFRSDS